jgi:hypothetical protein
MLHGHEPVLTRCADKYAVRGYVAERGLSSILNDLYGAWDTPDAIDFAALPQAFVLKVPWGCGMNILCPDRSAIDPGSVRERLRDWLTRNHYWVTREWSYKAIPPRIIAEAYLGPVSDYKIFCFHGEPHLVQLDQDRFARHTRDLFDCDWGRLPVTYVYPRCEGTPPRPPRPAQLDVMLACARVLSRGHPFVRVDLYAPGDAHVVFGEMTWYPEGAAGRFSPESYDVELGELLHVRGARQPGGARGANTIVGEHRERS